MSKKRRAKIPPFRVLNSENIFRKFVSKIMRSCDKNFAQLQFDPIEYNGVEYYLLFNINQSTFLRKEVIEKIEVYFTLHRKYYLKLRQALVTDFSKQGLDLYGAH